MFYGLSDRLIRRLQAVQNAAACLVTDTRRRNHISPVLWQLHWLPVHQRIKFKLAVLVYKSLYWPSSPILGWRLWTCCSCRPSSTTIVGHWHIRCSTNIHSVRRSGFSSCRTTVMLWNSLPSKLRQSDLTLHQFRRALKTYLFCWLGLQHLVTFVFSVLYKCSYLLTYGKRLQHLAGSTYLSTLIHTLLSIKIRCKLTFASQTSSNPNTS